MQDPDRAASAGGAAANRVRDHLANERTFLAWVRTALGLIGLGFVLARMGLFLRQLAIVGGEPAPHHIPVGHEFVITGLIFLALGTSLCAWSARLYRRTRGAIEAGGYEPASGSVAAVAALVVIGGLAIAAMLAWRTIAAAS